MLRANEPGERDGTELPLPAQAASDEPNQSPHDAVQFRRDSLRGQERGRNDLALPLYKTSRNIREDFLSALPVDSQDTEPDKAFLLNRGRGSLSDTHLKLSHRDGELHSRIGQLPNDF